MWESIVSIETNSTPRPKMPAASPAVDFREAQALHTQIKLMQSLQTSLQPDTLMALFFRHIQSVVKVDGIDFLAGDSSPLISCGKKKHHHCNYTLNIESGFMGKLTFFRKEVFEAQELATIERLITTLVYPLRNALDYQRLTQLSLQDALTGLGNRTALRSAVQRELLASLRYQHQLSLLMIDIDHFKKINDNYGHLKGDQIIVEVSQIILTGCRETDLGFRYGGEEFIVLLPNTDESGAQIIAERIRSHVEQLNISQADKDSTMTQAISVSIGVASLQHCPVNTAEALVKLADNALYCAKASGRNCVMTARADDTGNK